MICFHFLSCLFWGGLIVYWYKRSGDSWLSHGTGSHRTCHVVQETWRLRLGKRRAEDMLMYIIWCKLAFIFTWTPLAMFHIKVAYSCAVNLNGHMTVKGYGLFRVLGPVWFSRLIIMQVKSKANTNTNCIFWSCPPTLSLSGLSKWPCQGQCFRAGHSGQYHTLEPLELYASDAPLWMFTDRFKFSHLQIHLLLPSLTLIRLHQLSWRNHGLSCTNLPGDLLDRSLFNWCICSTVVPLHFFAELGIRTVKVWSAIWKEFYSVISVRILSKVKAASCTGITVIDKNIQELTWTLWDGRCSRFSYECASRSCTAAYWWPLLLDHSCVSFTADSECLSFSCPGPSALHVLMVQSPCDPFTGWSPANSRPEKQLPFLQSTGPVPLDFGWAHAKQDCSFWSMQVHLSGWPQLNCPARRQRLSRGTRSCSRPRMQSDPRCWNSVPCRQNLAVGIGLRCRARRAWS